MATSHRFPRSRCVFLAACTAFAWSAHAQVAGGLPDGPDREMAPIEPPVADDCITDVTPSDHRFSCGDITYHVMVDEMCTRFACGLIFDIHGAGMSAELLRSNTELHELALSRGYVVVHPSAAPNGGGTWSFTGSPPQLQDFMTRLIRAFHIDESRLHVTGFSMGACQAFQWAAQYPDMVRAACPIAGSARTGNFNKVFLLALRRTLELDPAYDDGFYERPPVRGLKAFAAIYAGWGTSEPFFREEAFRPLGSRSTEEHVADFWEPFFLKCDANDLLNQLWTWEAGDISANPTYEGNFEAALRAIKVRTIIVPIDNDRYFPPVDSENEARHIPGAKVAVVASAWGHMALMNAADIPAIDAPLKELLAD